MSDRQISGPMQLVIYAFLAVYFGFGVFIGQIIGHMECREQWQQEAIDRGYAERITGDDGGSVFRWKERQ